MLRGVPAFPPSFSFPFNGFNQISEEIVGDCGSFRKGHGIVATGA